ncbi:MULTISPECIES: rhodanese-like domain-containing protein [Comamonas]|jgi:rhodanese-related sulfurtransferase|uniref:Rhodanese-like domain-containing protein n=1 Tax=Comamonas squillarum TaxID=2977320 RepID=A0ABY5ZZW5_9BURK|nr:rhodanese-like domain-containing protein [Comamonas sp. PR12]UXC19552.1 rhodanese-like domain-containing protein [Comamonas sp. PR12]
MEQIRPAQLNEWLAQHADHNPLVLDVREPWELRTASVKPEGFELLNIPMQQIPASLNLLDEDRPIACLCHHGMRSMQVAVFLERQGYSQVSNLTGGIDLWTAERDPSVPRY